MLSDVWKRIHIRRRPPFVLVVLVHAFIRPSYMFAVAITSNKSSIPPTSKIMSGPEENHVFSPATSDRWRVLDLEEANAFLGRQRAGILPGVTFLFNDGPGTMGFLGKETRTVSADMALMIFSVRSSLLVRATLPCSRLYWSTSIIVISLLKPLLARGAYWLHLRLI